MNLRRELNDSGRSGAFSYLFDGPHQVIEVKVAVLGNDAQPLQTPTVRQTREEIRIERHVWLL